MRLFDLIGDETFDTEQAEVLSDHSPRARPFAEPRIVFQYRVYVSAIDAAVGRNAGHPNLFSQMRSRLREVC